ncbi:MAG: KH domain-containing protein [Candidatus Micrarchaeia archaeon]
MQHFLIPRERAKLLNGKLLEELEKRLGCSIRISDENAVTLDGDAYLEYNAKGVIFAFGRGFDAETSCKLLDDAHFLEVIDLKERIGDESRRKQIKARIIGRGGAAKTYIEKFSGTNISVYGDTVSIIGALDDIKVAKAAINAIAEGSMHRKAYTLMQMEKEKLRREKGA